MKTTAIALLLLLPATAEVTEIGVHRTPGKPMQFFESNRPAEEVVAKKEGDKFLLSVRVNVPRDGVKKYTEETAELTPKEWESVLEIVTKHKLLEWKPEQDGDAIDWGAGGFRVKSDKENAPTWMAPLKNGDGPAALSKRLASLAKEKLRGLKLFYVTP